MVYTAQKYADVIITRIKMRLIISKYKKWINNIMKKFDKEYSTQYTPEMKFLLEKGIKYTFVKEINGVTTYKYEKTPELFKSLEKFYSRK